MPVKDPSSRLATRLIFQDTRWCLADESAKRCGKDLIMICRAPQLILLALLITVSGVSSVSADVALRKGLGDLTGPWQLFVDDYLVARKTNVVRTYHRFKKHPGNPVLSPNKPWEGGRSYLYGTVLPNEEGRGYRMWYQGYNEKGNFGGRRGYVNAYATSKDGIHWEKPNLGIFRWRDSTANNIFLARKHSPGDDHNPQIIHTPWEKDPRKKYKMITFVYAANRKTRLDEGYWGSFSADGIHWTDMARNPVLPDGGDVGNFNWDAHRRTYMATVKIWATVPRGEGFRRCIGTTATKDFGAWPHPELVLVPDEIDDAMHPGRMGVQFYGLSSFAYESGYIGFLWIFRTGSGGQIYIQLVSSRDGINWIRVEPTNGRRPAALPNGPDGSWDAGCLFSSGHPVVEGDTIKLWYGAWDKDHRAPDSAITGRVGLATLRKDGFASLDAGNTTGLVTTRLLKGLGGRLHVNAVVRGGELRAEVLDADGTVLPGYGRAACKAVRGRGIEQRITWETHEELPVSKRPLKLRFVFNRASLYSFRAGPRVDVDDKSVHFRAFFDFEGDSGQVATDKATGDGSQQGRFHNNVTVTRDPANSQGESSLVFASDGKKLSTFQIVDTMNLGKNFTLATKVKTSVKRVTRLFSTYRGCDRPVAGELIFDFNPATGTVRFVANGQTVVGKCSIATSRYHHYAVTYDGGLVTLYFDGRQIGAGRLLSGTCYYDYANVGSVKERFNGPERKTVAGIYLSSDLRVGEDAAGKFEIFDRNLKPPGTTGPIITGPDEQLIGFADEILVTKRTLDAREIATLGRPKPPGPKKGDPDNQGRGR